MTGPGATGTGPGTVVHMNSLRVPCVVPVAGVSFRQAAVATMREGDQVVLRPDPENPYDPHAVAIERLDGELLGYLPRALAERAGQLRYRGVVSERLAGPEAIGLRIRVEGTETGESLTTPRVAAPTDAVEVEPGSAPVLAAVVDANGDAVLVRAKSGRVLGRLARVDDDKVWVLTANSTVPYPAHLVVVDAPAVAVDDIDPFAP